MTGSEQDETAAQTKTAIVLGGSSFIAPYLLRRLAERCYNGAVTSRRPHAADSSLPDGFTAQQLDATSPGDWRAPAGAIVVSLLPLPILVPLLPALAEAAQIVALGTSGVHYKQDSGDSEERAYIQSVVDAAAALEMACADSNTLWTLLQPTLVYAPWRDHNVSAIARFIRRFGFFPVASPGRGLRQPVHADDVARAAVAAIGNPKAENHAFVLAGGETLAYREMVARVFEALGRRPLIVALPGPLLRLAMGTAGRLFRYNYSSDLFDRMNRDAAFDIAEAREALAFAPRDFHPDFSEESAP